jgi:hypothetical protein
VLRQKLSRLIKANGGRDLPATEGASLAPLPTTEDRGGSLTTQQVAFFETFGFLLLPGLFADDIAEITAGFEEIFANHESWELTEDIHLNQPRRIIQGVLEQSDDSPKLYRDPRVVGIITSLLGPGYEEAPSDGSLFYCDSSWHSDTYGAPMSRHMVKISLYLDPLRAGTGAIRMIPGTNHYQSTFARTLRRDFTDVNGPEDVFGVDREEIPAYVLETEPGDAVVWDYRTIHASFGGRQRRRLLSLNFKEAAAEPAGAG